MPATTLAAGTIYDGTVNFTGDFKVRQGPIRVTATSNETSGFFPLHVGDNYIGTGSTISERGAPGLLVTWKKGSGTYPNMYFDETDTDGAWGSNYDEYTGSAIAVNTDFWLELERSGSTVYLRVYSDAYSTLADTMSFALSYGVKTYGAVTAMSKGMSGSSDTLSATVQGLDTAPSAATTTRPKLLAHSRRRNAA